MFFYLCKCNDILAILVDIFTADFTCTMLFGPYNNIKVMFQLNTFKTPLHPLLFTSGSSEDGEKD